jgi:histone-arginine methyltransferase CARM1
MELITGNGILSFLSAQAGAKRVVALEASSMADKMAIVSIHLFKLGKWLTNSL